MNTKGMTLQIALSLCAATTLAGPMPDVLTEIRQPVEVFTQRMVVVKGRGVAPSDRPLSVGQKELLAGRAAKVVALRELAEALGVVRVWGETLIQDAAARSDVVRATVDGMVRGAEVAYESYDDRKEIAEVYLRVNLDGPNGLTSNLVPTVLQQHLVDLPAGQPYLQPAAQAPAPPEPADGLIIDATGTGFRPAMINRIVTASGSPLFEPSKIAPDILAKKGCGEYTNDIGKAKATLAERGAKHPLVIKVAGVQSLTDAQVSDADAAAIFTANQKTNFLEGAKVVFVL